MIVLLSFVAVAVAVFIFSGSKTSSYAYLEEELFQSECGVTEMVEKRREQYKRTYTRNNVIGTGLGILSLIPLFCGVMINEENDILLTLLLSVTLLIVGISVLFFIQNGIVWKNFTYNCL